MSGPPGIKQRLVNTDAFVCTAGVCLCACAHACARPGGFRAVLQRTSRASLPVFEDGIKARDEKVRNVRNTANSEREKNSTSYWNKTIIDLFRRASFCVRVFFFFANMQFVFFFNSFFFFSPPTVTPQTTLLHDLRWISVKPGSSPNPGGF